MTYERLVYLIKSSIYETLIALALITIAFMALEPIASRAASDSDEFLVTQTVSGAIAFSVTAADVSMNGTLNGLTGGTSYGTTTVAVTTNNASGYNMTISFSSTTAMARNGAEQNAEILNFQYGTGTASYPTGFDTSVNYAQFGFSVNASNTADISSLFTGTAGTACGTAEGTTFTIGDCWRGASSTNAAATTELINRNSPTPPSGSTSSVLFRITIPNGPNPAVPDGTYTATATLTATDN